MIAAVLDDDRAAVEGGGGDGDDVGTGDREGVAHGTNGTRGRAGGGERAEYRFLASSVRVVLPSRDGTPERHLAHARTQRATVAEHRPRVPRRPAGDHRAGVAAPVHREGSVDARRRHRRAARPERHGPARPRRPPRLPARTARVRARPDRSRRVVADRGRVRDHRRPGAGSRRHPGERGCHRGRPGRRRRRAPGVRSGLGHRHRVVPARGAPPADARRPGRRTVRRPVPRRAELDRRRRHTPRRSSTCHRRPSSWHR